MLWFLFGAILLSCLSTYFTYQNYYGHWQGVLAKTKGIEFKYKLRHSTYFDNYLYLGIKSNFQQDFYLKKEFWFDRIAKRLGIAKEIQTGNQKFDDKIYLMSDNDQLYHFFKSNKALLNILSEFFSKLDVHSYPLREVRQRYGEVWIKIKVENDFKSSDCQHLALILAPRLGEITERLSKLEVPKLTITQDYFEIKAAIFLGIGGGFTLNSLIHYLYISGNKLPLIVDKSSLINTSFTFALMATLLLLFLVFLVLGRRARTHLVLFQMLTIGSIACFFTIYVGIYKINVNFDEAQKNQYQTQVIYKHVTTRNFSKRYNIKIKNWKDEKQPVLVEVSKKLYDELNYRAEVNAVVGRGYMGFQWIDSISKLE